MSFHIRPTHGESREAAELVRPYIGERVYIRGGYVHKGTYEEQFRIEVINAPQSWAPDSWTSVLADDWLKEFHAYRG